MKTFCKCGCEHPLTDYEYRKWSGYKRGHEPLPWMKISESIEKESVRNATLYILTIKNTLLIYTTNIHTKFLKK